jgi:hypothetical protein
MTLDVILIFIELPINHESAFAQGYVWTGKHPPSPSVPPTLSYGVTSRRGRRMSNDEKNRETDLTEGTGSNKKKLWPPLQNIRLSPSAVTEFRLFFV